MCLAFSEAPIEITVPLKNIEAMEEDTVTFTCELSKKDRTDGKWTFKGQEVTVSERFKIETKGNTQTLTIANITLDDAADVSYSIETASTEATLLINGKIVMMTP